MPEIESKPVIPRRNMDVKRQRDEIQKTQAASGYEPCFMDIGKVVGNRQFSGSNSCDTCRFKTNCHENTGTRLARARHDRNWVCFADPRLFSLTTHSKCHSCSLKNDCSFIIDEFARLGKAPSLYFTHHGKKPVSLITSSATAALGPTKDVALGEVVATACAGPLPPAARESTATLMAVASPVALSTPAPSKKSAPTYRFPNEDPKFTDAFKRAERATDDALSTFIEQLSFLRGTTGNLLSYAAIRPAFCAVSIVLNQRQTRMPHVRETRKFVPTFPKVPVSPDESDLSNDRQVIDLHWLWARKGGMSNSMWRPKRRWKSLLKGEQFDFATASTFVATVGAPASKVKELGLRERPQLHLAVIQQKSVKDRWVTILEGAEKTRSCLDEKAESPSSRFKADDIEHRVEEYKALRACHGDATPAVKFLRMMTGRDVSPDVMRQRVKQFGKWKIPLD